jgi:hypothetical protein
MFHKVNFKDDTIPGYITFTASTGSDEFLVPAYDTHNPSTSDSVFTFDIASAGFIPSFIARTIWEISQEQLWVN